MDEIYKGYIKFPKYLILIILTEYKYKLYKF